MNNQIKDDPVAPHSEPETRPVLATVRTVPQTVRTIPVQVRSTRHVFDVNGQEVETVTEEPRTILVRVSEPILSDEVRRPIVRDSER
jgi:hypothetical protein